MKATLLAISVITLVPLSFAQQPTQPQAAAAPPAVLSDGTGAKFMHVDNMHAVRYIELFLACRDPKTGNLVAPCYNTLFTPKGIPASRDTAPQALVAGLNMDKIKEQFGILENEDKLVMIKGKRGTGRR
jgi:hypothetical protein